MGLETEIPGNGTQKVKMIFNPMAGAARKHRIDIEEAIRQLQAMGLQPEPWILEPGCDLRQIIQNGQAEGCSMVVVCGGDGTISPVAAELAGTGATLAILPAGTRNNVARSIGIPDDLAAAANIVKNGRRVMIDMGVAACGSVSAAFLELCAVGLVSAITPPGDAARHGELAGIKEFLWTLFSAEPSEISVSVDGCAATRHRGHAVVVTNMPYTGLSFQFGPEGCQRDGLLNVTHFADLSKLELLKHISTGIHPEKQEDPRIRHCLATSVDIATEPLMPVMIDGRVIGKGPVHIEVLRRALAVMAP